MTDNCNCIDDTNAKYDEARRIKNARFNLEPALICYCSNEDEVAAAIQCAKDKGLEIRIRAGGHHHEGMCSGDGVLLLDVSRIANIDVDDTFKLAAVGPGATNGDIYKKLWNRPQGRHFAFPGGGCETVCVGGFLQGGGWGPYSRELGMGCDSVAAFRIVMHDKKPYTVEANDSRPGYRELFWSVLGGGGGNFGVVTQYWLNTSSVTTELMSFTVWWEDPAKRLDVMRDWCDKSTGGDRRLTSFCRITTPDRSNTDWPVVVGGICRASEAETRRLLGLLLPNTIGSAKVKVEPVHKAGATSLTLPDYQPGPPHAALRAAGLVAADSPVSGLVNTCAGQPLRHMVSSCFPTATFGENAIQALASYIGGTKPDDLSRRYLSLHSMGGAIADAAPNSFPWRKQRFMLQYQAWWVRAPDNADIDERSMAWLTKIRNEMNAAKLTHGSFINFPDREIKIDHYYGDHFGLLKGYRGWYDPDGVFDFDMSIPRG